MYSRYVNLKMFASYFVMVSYKSRLLFTVNKTRTALNGATTRTDLPSTQALEDVGSYFAAHQDEIRGVIDEAVSRDVYVKFHVNSKFQS